MRPSKISIGQKFGRLTIIADSGARNRKGEIAWSCICDCGAHHRATSGNLSSGSVRSCGCLARELTSARRKKSRQPPKVCQYPDCKATIEKGGKGYCGLHAQRIRRHGDPSYVTPENVRRERNRAALLHRFPSVKPSTYRKLFGRHEHRVIAEEKAGRTLRPDEHVHHKDHDKQNNAPENLEVLPAREHLALHAALRKKSKC
ncbi:HNH endonuclease signature motif containing protein [Antarctobacter heliothermus]|uniref:HNH endonuclease n=1 Tax=Antarctobacter heliothermus TaxID=74033 RepID=A0A239BCB1_9RHOB|nr:HNH endonuclease signature motif containing protein [Antarctobacter heliothermus]SNS05607.1 HNH endonuclease [Antarctobacter heliothermus]